MDLAASASSAGVKVMLAVLVRRSMVFANRKSCSRATGCSKRSISLRVLSTCESKRTSICIWTDETVMLVLVDVVICLLIATIILTMSDVIDICTTVAAAAASARLARPCFSGSTEENVGGA